jgi:hypothetical protein
MRKAGRKEFEREKFILEFAATAAKALMVLLVFYSFLHRLTRQKNQPKKMAPQALTPQV